METSEKELPYRERMFRFVKDPELAQLEKKYEPYLDLHDLEEISELYDIVQAPPNDAITGRLIWTTQRDLPIDLKKDIIAIYSRYFVK